MHKKKEETNQNQDNLFPKQLLLWSAQPEEVNHEGETYSAPGLAGQLPNSPRLKEKQKTKQKTQNGNKTKQSRKPQTKPNQTKKTSTSQAEPNRVQKQIVWFGVFNSLFFVLTFVCARPAREIFLSKIQILPEGNQKVRGWMTD